MVLQVKANPSSSASLLQNETFLHFQNDPAATSGGWPGGGRGGADDPDQRGGGEVGGEPDGELGGERGEGAG